MIKGKECIKADRLPERKSERPKRDKSSGWHVFGTWTHPYYHKSHSQSQMEQGIQQTVHTWNKPLPEPTTTIHFRKPIFQPKPDYEPTGPGYRMLSQLDRVALRENGYKRYTMPDTRTASLKSLQNPAHRDKPIPCLRDQHLLLTDLRNYCDRDGEQGKIRAEFERQANAQWPVNKCRNMISSDRDGTKTTLDEHLCDCIDLETDKNSDHMNTAGKLIPRPNTADRRILSQKNFSCESTTDLPTDYDKQEDIIEYSLVAHPPPAIKPQQPISEVWTGAVLGETHAEKNVRLSGASRPPGGKLIIRPATREKSYREIAEELNEAEPNLYTQRLISTKLPHLTFPPANTEQLRLEKMKELDRQGMLNYPFIIRGITGYAGHQPRQALELPLIRPEKTEKRCRSETTYKTFYSHLP